MKKYNIGISQGRLIKPPNNQLQWFPGKKWEEEFLIAQKIGINHIEFLAEIYHNSSNPLWSNEGRHEITKVSEKCNIERYSACFDFIIKNKINNLSTDSEIIIYTKDFINSCHKIGIKIIILPFLEKNELNDLNLITIKKYLDVIVPYAFTKKILIAIESLAEPNLLIKLLSEFENFSLGCVYDTGNRVLISKDQEQDIKTLNKFINHVHIKDKNKDNENVVLGKGIVDFKKIFSALNEINYLGMLTMETNRGEDPIETAINNIKIINHYSS
tara:strand:- start:3364 stop:4179 length:816 start_codon:yes stop_codon:yes gene_type:complete